MWWLAIILLGVAFFQWFYIAKQKKIIQNLMFYQKTFSQMHDNIRCFRHDFYNFIQALNGYIQCNDLEGAKSMTNAICKECESVISLEMLTPEKIMNPAIYHLIASKYEKAHKNHILMQFEIEEPFEEMALHTYLFCKILGILLDNAIEASKETEDKRIWLRFLKEKENNLLIIENSFVDKEIEIERLFDVNYTTKKEKKNHGLGLWKVREIVESEDNLQLDTYIKDSFFVQKLTIQKREKGFHFSSQRKKILAK